MNNQAEETKERIVFLDLPCEIKRGTIGGILFFNTRYYELVEVSGSDRN